MNLYSLQYWLYASLNKRFGKELRFERDALRSCYSVHRHCFTVKTNTLALGAVASWLKQHLRECAYVEVNPSIADGSLRAAHFVKSVDGKTQHVNLRYSTSLGAKPQMEISLTQHKETM